MPSSWKICFAASLDASSPNRTTGKVTEEPSGPAGVISPTRNQQGARMSSGCAPALHHKVSSIGRFRLPTYFFTYSHGRLVLTGSPLRRGFAFQARAIQNAQLVSLNLHYTFGAESRQVARH